MLARADHLPIGGATATVFRIVSAAAWGVGREGGVVGGGELGLAGASERPFKREKITAVSQCMASGFLSPHWHASRRVIGDVYRLMTRGN